MKNETSNASHLTEKVYGRGVCAQNDGSTPKSTWQTAGKYRETHAVEMSRDFLFFWKFHQNQRLDRAISPTAAAFLFWMWITIKSRSGKDDNCNPIAHWPVWQRLVSLPSSALNSRVCVAAHQFRTLTVTNAHLIDENWGNPKPRFSNLATSLTDFTERKRQHLHRWSWRQLVNDPLPQHKPAIN